MQITINQTQIEKAILDFMHKRINIKEGTEVRIEMKATRGAEGFSANIEIIDDLASHEAMLEQEKARQSNVKEEKLDKASSFLKSKTKAAAEPEPEEEQQADTEEEADAEDAGAVQSDEAEPTAEAPTRKAKGLFNKLNPN